MLPEILKSKLLSIIGPRNARKNAKSTFNFLNFWLMAGDWPNQEQQNNANQHGIIFLSFMVISHLDFRSPQLSTAVLPPTARQFWQQRS